MVFAIRERHGVEIDNGRYEAVLVEDRPDDLPVGCVALVQQQTDGLERKLDNGRRIGH